jgi:hypothetical protein
MDGRRNGRKNDRKDGNGNGSMEGRMDDKMNGSLSPTRGRRERVKQSLGFSVLGLLSLSIAAPAADRLLRCRAWLHGDQLGVPHPDA